MPVGDLLLVFQWWGTLFLVGAACYPFTKYLFNGWPTSTRDDSTRGWFDRGFLFTKAVGVALLTFIIYIFGIVHIAPFTLTTVWVALGIIFVMGISLQIRKNEHHSWKRAFMLLLEEIFFFCALLFWTWVKAHEPSIHNLEKFMDFGFTKSILGSLYFPAPDMWYAGNPINYYYFGHTAMAVLTKLSGIDLAYTFNLMLSTIFAFSFTMSFSIGYQLLKKNRIAGGILTAFLVTLAGNMQTIYAFTIGYDGENVVPFWTLLGKMDLARYWYANATRFIPFTIHEFPSYSFVVSDVHGHVLSIPFVLLAIALLIKQWEKKTRLGTVLFYGFLCGLLLMTNALDGPIYLGLFIILAIFARKWKEIFLVTIAAILTSIPFLLHFSSFVSGIAVNCPPSFLSETHLGPLLFEGVDKCQRSPLWMWWLLWGFFVYCGGWLVARWKKFQPQEILLVIIFFFSLVLLIFPEFFYFKDIYPMHFRSNTMFKLGYQAFIMLSIISGYVIVTTLKKKLFLLLLIPQLFLVSIYPIFSVRSYFNSLKNYQGIFGMDWIRRDYPDDWKAIVWLNKETRDKRQDVGIVEADGDSYTDHARVSALTGLPTIIGWPVHEWLWRGSYDVVAPRREDVRKIYESNNITEMKEILSKYSVRYIIVGKLERDKYMLLQEDKFKEIATPVFTQGETVIYKL